MEEVINVISHVEPYSVRAYLRWCRVHSPVFQVFIEEDKMKNRWISLVRVGFSPINGFRTGRTNEHH